jgi:DNA-binding phage protein
MSKKTIRKRISRKATPAEQRRHGDIREQVAADLPALKERALTAVRQAERLRGVLGALRTRRQAMGISLSELSERSGIDRARLSRLENEQGNPTIQTLTRIADALDAELCVTVESKRK